MGKTEKGAIWLDEKLFSSYEYWQFWRNSDDRDVKKFLKFFTDIEVNKIENLIENKEINELKIILANETTRILHGEKKSLKAEKTAHDIFKLGRINEDLPTKNIPKKDIETGIKLLELLVNAKIMKSRGEARRAINNNGIKINDALVGDENKILEFSDFKKENMKVSFGKKKHFLFKII